MHTRMDEQAKTRSKLLRKDALRDHPVVIHIDLTATSIAAPYMNIEDFFHGPRREHTL
jgi:hypothetical protein